VTVEPEHLSDEPHHEYVTSERIAALLHSCGPYPEYFYSTPKVEPQPWVKPS
jgi:hypothetical protein